MNSAENPTDNESPGDGKDEACDATRKGRRVPPFWVWGVVIVLGAAIAYIRATTFSGDHAIVNILTFAFGFFALQAVAFWFVFRSGYSRRLRFGSALTAIALLAAFFLVFKVHHVSGEMVPVFRLRFAPAPDELLRLPQPQAGDVDLAAKTESDFSQFLGPERNGWTDVVELSANWSPPPRVLWRQPIGAGWSSFSAMNGFAVTMEQRGSEELVTCYDIRTGELRWTYGVSTRHETLLGGAGPRSTPTIHDGRVFTLGATGHLACLDGASGEPIWTDDLLQRYGVTPEEDGKAVAWGRAGSPLVVGQRLIVPAGGPLGGPYKSLAAFDKDSGYLLWEGGKHQVSYASPAIGTVAGREQIVSVDEHFVSGYDIETGDTLWTHPWKGSSNADASNSQPVFVDETHILLSKGYTGGAMLIEVTAAEGAFSTREVWHETRLLKTKFTNVVLRGGYAYGLSDGILECVEVLSGQRKWKRGRYGHGQILGVGDQLLVLSETGEVALIGLDPERFEERASFAAVDGKTWNNICLYGNLLLVRNGEEAACYELPTLESEKEVL